MMEGTTQEEHSKMVRALAKPGEGIMTPNLMHNLHMAVGVSGEAGELLNAVKKAAIYCKPIDRANKKAGE
jgi:hypothetical protein